MLAAVAMLSCACSGPQTASAPGSAEAPSARALSTRAPISRIAFGSCAFEWAEQPIFRAVVAAEPDLYLSLGDAIYGDFDGKTTFDVTPESLRPEWQKLADHPDWQHLRANLPVMATWDNHDYGHHSAGSEIDWDAHLSPLITLRIVDVDGRVALEHAMALADLHRP